MHCDLHVCVGFFIFIWSLAILLMISISVCFSNLIEIFSSCRVYFKHMKSSHSLPIGNPLVKNWKMPNIVASISILFRNVHWLNELKWENSLRKLIQNQRNFQLATSTWLPPTAVVIQWIGSCVYDLQSTWQQIPVLPFDSNWI